VFSEAKEIEAIIQKAVDEQSFDKNYWDTTGLMDASKSLMRAFWFILDSSVDITTIDIGEKPSEEMLRALYAKL
jgi:hypothetical protein